MEPTASGYLEFIRNIMGISSALLPDNSPVIGYSYNIALATVNEQLQAIKAPSDPYYSIYALAVYNLAGDRLINYAPDLDGSPVIPGSNPPLKYFAYSRKQYQLNSFVSGVVQSTSDESTSVSLVVPKALELLTIGDLQNLKTPWGRQYLAIAQDTGTDWGIS